MKKSRFVLTVLSILSLATVITIASAGQSSMMQWQGSGGWGPGGQYQRMYDPNTVATVRGEVVSVDRFTPPRGQGMSQGIHLIVKTDGEEMSVHLGPAWYLENQEVKIEPGDKVEVKGSRVTFDGKPAIIAAEIQKGDDVLTLRDAKGFPRWSGWRRR